MRKTVSIKVTQTTVEASYYNRETKKIVTNTLVIPEALTSDNLYEKVQEYTKDEKLRVVDATVKNEESKSYSMSREKFIEYCEQDSEPAEETENETE